jgi:hypothetical protein
MVKLTSSDGQEFVVPREVAGLSVLIKNMLEDFGEDTDTPIPLPNVSGPILAKGRVASAFASASASALPFHASLRYAIYTNL